MADMVQDKRQISFIIWQRDPSLYEDLIISLGTLRIPDGYAVDVVTVSDVSNKAAAYNIGSQQSNAQYKIYIDEKARILNKDFLLRMLEIFSLDSSIGMLGLAGTRVIPTTGDCQQARKRAGRMLLIDDECKETVWSDIQSVCEPVASLDGGILAVQADIPWRQELFRTDDFLVTAQCQEYHRKQYKTVVPSQETAWGAWAGDCHKCDFADQQVFLTEYSREIYPLVLIVIPTYNRPEYCQQALDSALAQTYRNIEILVTDNSTDNRTEQMMQAYEADVRVKYIHHKGGSAYDNWKYGREYAKKSPAAFVNWLMDDDLFHPDKIQRMMAYYLEYDGISLVTSYRAIIDAEGKLLGDVAATRRICDKDTIFDGRSIGRKILFDQMNFVGEPTTVLLKKDCLREADFGWSEGLEQEYRRYAYPDIPTWLQLLSKGNMAYLAEPLSYFRFHEGQEQRNLHTMLGGPICWYKEIEYGYKTHQYIESFDEYCSILINWVMDTMKYLAAAEQEKINNAMTRFLWQAIGKTSEIMLCRHAGKAAKK